MDPISCSLPVLIVLLLGAYVAGNALHSRPGYDDLQLPKANQLNRWVVIGLIVLLAFTPLICIELIGGMIAHH